jgi:arginine/ornithine transport system substrate-binding protein
MVVRRVALVLLAMAGLAGTPALAQDWKVVRVAIEGSYPPFSERDGKKGWKGFDIDIANALCVRMRADCTFVQRDWDQIQDALLRKEVDAIVASMSITVARKQRMDFTNRYYHTAARFVGLEDAELEISPAGLAGKKVGVQDNTVHENYVRSEYGAQSQIVTFATTPEGVAALKSGAIDVFLGDAMALQSSFLAKPAGKGYAFLGAPVTEARFFGEGIGIAIRKDDQDLRWKLNRALDEIRADGTYQELSQRYFGFDVYGAS